MRERADKFFVTQTILSVIAAAGLIGVALVAPNVLQALAPFLKTKRHQNYYIKGRLKRLVDRGLVSLEKDGGDNFVTLTAKGKGELAQLQIKHNFDLKKKKWDGKWRVVMFDIKEFKRGVRDWLRIRLNECGLIRLQNSVWVTPYDCAELVDLLKADIGLGREVIYMTAEKIDQDQWLKKRFDL